MRNLLQYPITDAEKIEAVERACKEEIERVNQNETDVPIGDVHLAALHAVLKDLKEKA